MRECGGTIAQLLRGEREELSADAMAAARLGLDHWKGNVRDTLKTLDDIYRFAVEQTAMARGELLELIIVLIWCWSWPSSSQA